ncbi:MAG: bifunctional 5,10-methylenetetrahydrofolate dehydrogenase/5,10-methenyltetrahydrofolate cyclohydrolase [Minisyncoccia bacterium]
MNLLSAQPIIDTIIPTIPEGLNLAVILVGDDMASQIYIDKKSQALTQVNGKLQLFKYSADIVQEDLIEAIQKLNADSMIDGIIVQLPLSPFLEEHTILNAIHPLKDADGLTDYWLGKLFQNRISANLAPIIPATPKGILLLLDYYDIDLVGKTVLVINDSVLVGKPLATILPAYGATPILAHKETQELKKLINLSDIIVSATGNATILENIKFRENQILIDVGILRDEESKVRGDIYHKDFKFDGQITPVPGGVGPLTVWALIQNLANLKKLKSGELK